MGRLGGKFGLDMAYNACTRESNFQAFLPVLSEKGLMLALGEEGDIPWLSLLTKRREFFMNN